MWACVTFKILNKLWKPQISYVCSLKLTREIWGLVGHYYVIGSRDQKLITPADSFSPIYPETTLKVIPWVHFRKSKSHQIQPTYKWL